MKRRIWQIGTTLTTWARRWWWGVVLVLVLMGGVSLGVMLSQRIADQVALQMEQTNLITEADKRLAAQKDLFQYQTDNQIKIWTTLAQATLAVAAAIGGYFTYRNLRVAQEGQITNRFTQAIGQLGAELKDGKPNLEVRLGGIYALERIARDSARDRVTIMEILTAYVRENARWIEPSPSDGVVSSPEDIPLKQPATPEHPPPPRVDIQAVLTVISRRRRAADRLEPIVLDLGGTDLRLANLEVGHLQMANLEGAHLDEASLLFARLALANLKGAHLKGATLANADLQLADFQAHLEGASLTNANLHVADLTGADLTNANLEEADLRVANLTQEQVYSAYKHGDGALLPPDWPDDWRDRLEKSTERPPVTPTAP
jgi:Pentapeptide repeats (8 copies)